jgi:AbrB family looped-hinge helix DNA binding protein
MTLTLDKFGRVVLPKEVRDRLDLQAGDQLDVVAAGNGLLLRPVRDATPLKRKAGLLVFHGKAEGDLEDAVRRGRQERIRDP